MIGKSEIDSELKNNLWEYFLTLPTGIQLIVILFFAPIFYLGYKFIKDEKFRSDVLEFRKRTEFSPSKFEPSKLLKHDLFMSRSLFKRYVANVRFDYSEKTWIFNEILRIKTTSTIELTTVFIRGINKGLKASSMTGLMYALIDDIIVDYEHKIYASFTSKYGENIGHKIYDFAYVRGFVPYHEQNVNLVTRTIERQGESRIPNNFKVWALLNLLYVALDAAIFDCERVFRDFNGEIKKMVESIED